MLELAISKQIAIIFINALFFFFELILSLTRFSAIASPGFSGL